MNSALSTCRFRYSGPSVVFVDPELNSPLQAYLDREGIHSTEARVRTTREAGVLLDGTSPGLVPL